jgi:hypothetical protein
VNLYSYVGNIPLYFTDPYGLVSGTKNHIYPLYLGGHPDQPLRDHPEEKHHKIFHESLSKQGYPMGKRGRQKWRDASDAERRRALDQALQDSGDPRYQGENGKKNRDKDLNDATSDDYEPAPGENNTDLRKNSKNHKSEQMRERGSVPRKETGCVQMVAAVPVVAAKVVVLVEKLLVWLS